MNSIGIDDSVLLELERSLKEIELEHAVSIESSCSKAHSLDDYDDENSDVTPTLHNRNTKTFWDDDSYDDESSDDDENPEKELSVMMNTLVAELQAEIQEQIVREIGEATESRDNEEAVNIPQPIKPQELDDYVPVQDYTKSKVDVEPIIEERVQDTTNISVSEENKVEDVRATGLEPSLSELSIQKTQLVQILRDHIANRRAPLIKQTEWDVRQIPDLEASEATHEFEPMIHIEPTDPDYVTVQDYSPRRSRRRSKRDKERKPPDATTSGISIAPLSSSFVQPSNSKHSKRRRTNKHQKKRKHLEQLIFECAVPEHKSRDEAIRKLADSPFWKTICQITFEGKAS
jgi:hypothetical protein